MTRNYSKAERKYLADTTTNGYAYRMLLNPSIEGYGNLLLEARNAQRHKNRKRNNQFPLLAIVLTRRNLLKIFKFPILET